MIIVCPACSTRYVLPDGAIAAAGRVVRCAKCRDSWFQEGPEPDPGLVEPLPATPEPETPPPPVTSPPVIAASSPVHYSEPPQTQDFATTPSSFAHEPPFRPRRSRAKWWILAAILLALGAIVAIGVMKKFGAPDWLPLPHGAFAQTEPDLELDFPKNRQERRPLPNGSDFFNVSGSIRNTSNERHAVPMLLIILRDVHNNIVYSLETASAKPVLAPGESETINQAIIDAPKSASAAEIRWKPS